MLTALTSCARWRPCPVLNNRAVGRAVIQRLANSGTVLSGACAWYDAKHSVRR